MYVSEPRRMNEFSTHKGRVSSLSQQHYTAGTVGPAMRAVTEGHLFGGNDLSGKLEQSLHSMGDVLGSV